ncbi:hypothetical protein GCM10010448_39830 [Streptomyces glomeratus]|uniref:Uncharacterized protein n=1 Tax=Streptomyces glomeratus TaxID=284452 RepID=A0ABP6LNF0_9ACTN
MCTSHEPGQGPAPEAPQAGAGRRSFLRATALLSVAATTGVALPAAAAAAEASGERGWRPEIRDWRDAAPGIVIGMEGAPGAQGAAIPGRRSSRSTYGGLSPFGA